MLHQLRELGVRIALDDFGTGYSSLSYLQRFPFDKIKIDRCFINDIAEPDGSSSIVQAVVNIAAARNMTTTAEGVETEQQREILLKLGCTEMQGICSVRRNPPQRSCDSGPRVTRSGGGISLDWAADLPIGSRTPQPKHQKVSGDPGPAKTLQPDLRKADNWVLGTFRDNVTFSAAKKDGALTLGLMSASGPKADNAPSIKALRGSWL